MPKETENIFPPENQNVPAVSRFTIETSKFKNPNIRKEDGSAMLITETEQTDGIRVTNQKDNGTLVVWKKIINVRAHETTGTPLTNDIIRYGAHTEYPKDDNKDHTPVLDEVFGRKAYLALTAIDESKINPDEATSLVQELYAIQQKNDAEGTVFARDFLLQHEMPDNIVDDLFPKPVNNSDAEDEEETAPQTHT
jgi:hypothetical protein